MKIGVLALQGAFREHRWMLEKCGATVAEVRRPDDLAGLAGLVIPGGESTTIGKLMVEWGLLEEIKDKAGRGMAIYGTCAGMILLARDIAGSSQPRLGLMDTRVIRNAFGSQRESFEVDLDIAAVGPPPVRAVFIRAPFIEWAGPAVEVMATLPDGKIVVARQGRLLVSAFHPELTEDDRLHRYFLSLCESS